MIQSSPSSASPSPCHAITITIITATQAQSALELYRKDYLAARKRVGEGTKWSASQWPEIQASFDALPEAEKAEGKQQPVNDDYGDDDDDDGFRKGFVR